MSVQAMKARFRAGPPVMISVHRADWGPLPENSTAAIRSASKWDVVEVDVALDAAGDAFLMHDATLERMTGHTSAYDGADPELLASLTLREGAGGRGAVATDHRIPRLAQAFQAIDGTKAIFDLDAKRPVDVAPVAVQVAALGAQDRATVKIKVSCTDDIALLKTLETAHGVMVMAKVDLTSPKDLDVIRDLRDADQAVAEVWFDTIDLLSDASRIAGETLRLGTYTLDPVHCCQLSDSRALNDPDAVWGRLIDAGIGQIMTDQSAALSAYLSR